jgi:hypothetical protein
MPSVAVDPSLKSVDATLVQEEPAANTLGATAASGATQGQLMPSAGDLVKMGTLGILTKPKVLKIKKLGIKKSSL